MKKKHIISIVILAVTSLFFSTSVFAYNLYSYKWAGSSYPIKLTYKWGDTLDDALNSVIAQAFSSAVSDWNNCQSKIKFSESSSASNELNSYYLSSTNEYGICTTTYSGNTLTKFIAKVNAGNSSITTSNIARSAASHELGHGIGLDHEMVATAIMKTSRDRTIIYKPQTDDTNGINAQYR